MLYYCVNLGFPQTFGYAIIHMPSHVFRVFIILWVSIPCFKHKNCSFTVQTLLFQQVKSETTLIRSCAYMHISMMHLLIDLNNEKKF